MKRSAVLAVMISTLGLLASCAPTLTGPQVGRIVNAATGEEGRVSFTRGTLRPRLDGPNAPDNVTIQIGGQTYTGRTVLVDAAATPTRPSWGLSFGFGNTWGGTNPGWPGSAWRSGWGTHWNSDDVALTRTGNLIARTATTPPLTITCTLTVDEGQHGVGDCTGPGGTKYAMQF